MDAACAAKARTATEFGTGEFERVAENPEQWGVGFDVYIFFRVINPQSEVRHGDAEDILRRNEEKGK
jgi:hypothetical protein